MESRVVYVLDELVGMWVVYVGMWVYRYVCGGGYSYSPLCVQYLSRYLPTYLYYRVNLLACLASYYLLFVLTIVMHCIVQYLGRSGWGCLAILPPFKVCVYRGCVCISMGDG